MYPINLSKLPELTDIDEVEKYSEKDKPLFDELYGVLKKHNALDRFGVTLLHSHFHIGENEILLESTDRETRTQIIEPVSLDTITDFPYIETSWRLDVNGVNMACICKSENTSVPPQHVHRSK